MKNINRRLPKDSGKVAGSLALIVIGTIIAVAVLLFAMVSYDILPIFPQDDKPYAIFITDSHIGRGNGETNLRIAINNINKMEPQPEFVIVGGDLVDWGEGISGRTNWERFVNEMNRLECSWHVIPGNHDYRFIQQVTPPYSLTNYDQFFDNHEDYTFDYSDIHFIALDSGPDKWELTLTPQSTGLTNSQIQWLEHDLDMLDGIQNEQDMSNKTKIIIMHHPAMDKLNEGVGCIGNNRADFVDLCLNYNVYAVLSGHTHTDTNYDFMGVDYNRHSSGPQFTTTLSILESVGYRKIILDDSQLPEVLSDSQSFDWEKAVNNPVGDYFGNIGD